MAPSFLRSISSSGRLTLPIRVRRCLDWPETVLIEAAAGRDYLKVTQCSDSVAERLAEHPRELTHRTLKRLSSGVIPATVDCFGRIQIPYLLRRKLGSKLVSISMDSAGIVELRGARIGAEAYEAEPSLDSPS